MMETPLFWAIAIPLIGSVAIVAAGRSPNLRETVTLITAAALFLTVASLTPEVLAGERPSLVIWKMLPGLELMFRVEPLGMLFGLVASGLWIVNSIYSIGYMRGNNERNQTRFYFFFAISLASAVGVAFSGNMLTLFIFYEILTICTYPLVAHSGSEEAVKSGRTYLGILIATSIGLQLLAIIWTWQATGTLDFTEGGILEGKVSGGLMGVLLFLYMYGIGKAALMPVHRWLPAAMVAPTPVSALLHAVAVVKAGVFTVVKVIVYIFGIDLLHGTGASFLLAGVAAATLLLASIIAMRKDNLKARLAYSTVSQLSYIILGAAIATGASVVGGGMHIAMHAFGKITLFFCAGAIYTAHKLTLVSEMNGIGRKMPVTMAAFLIGALSVIGLPPMGGAWSKWQLMLGAAEAEQFVFIAVWMLSSVLSAAYLIPLVLRAFFQPLPEPASAGAAAAGGDTGGIEEAPLFCLIAICISAAGTFILFFLAGEIAQLLAPLAKP
ncbi:MAG: proton-conducting transporter membrane subunit [Rhodospirillales bacterium]|jgi:multicomponent Na+:H+ antiporter subunit D|nr:proton-conducting transporter membrane subunit [Rhodospirillales bacterium]MDP6644042.1 proton-conducting transporter membrane subunit [Rhodospirillales bacterium]MDP6842567.1 proton-conducting transporter membrane subunit [Rhodospirillales bacterium]|tara:strand:+ start:3456 stop:4943 length:1488 start_codon:yes stop_codon:yes gene_type:complete